MLKSKFLTFDFLKKKIQETQTAEIQIPHLEKEIHEQEEIKFLLTIAVQYSKSSRIFLKSKYADLN